MGQGCYHVVHPFRPEKQGASEWSEVDGMWRMQVSLVADMPAGDARRDDDLISEVADTLVQLMAHAATRKLLLNQPQVDHLDDDACQNLHCQEYLASELQPGRHCLIGVQQLLLLWNRWI